MSRLDMSRAIGIHWGLAVMWIAQAPFSHWPDYPLRTVGSPNANNSNLRVRPVQPTEPLSTP